MATEIRVDAPGRRPRRLSNGGWSEAMKDGRQIQPRRRKKGPVKKPPDRPLPLPDGEEREGVKD
jgi:hypothetical protein